MDNQMISFLALISSNGFCAPIAAKREFEVKQQRSG
jgi:hypothetical protein